MEFGLAVFRARTETTTFASLLKSYGVRVMIISTPRQINVSCGISVRFNPDDIERARSILTRRKFNTFAGFYLVKQVGVRLKITPLD
ncbi:MAG: DUF3343 domain-containing protein [Clostridia bacterium]|nr:DUF3343 domain-containing protein [Clostridia bacterium]